MSNDKYPTGPKLYRLQRRASSDEKLTIFVQQRRWFRWHDHYHVDNERRKAMLDVLKSLEELQDALERVEFHDKDLKDANVAINRDVSERRARFWSPGGDTSDKWRGPAAKSEDDLPDITEKFKALVKKFDLNSLRDHQTRKAKAGVGGPSTAYYIEGKLPPDLDLKTDDIDLTHGWRLQGRPNNRSRSQSSNKSNQNQKNQNQE